jgi:hypothetical protein
VIRCGPHGPDHQLGHAHADLLSFDASRGAVRVVTDTGTGVYAAGPVRERLRSTAAHNTIALDGVELLEAWSSFRAGRRGRARCHARGEDARFVWLWASHDAYAHLVGAPRPHRLLAVSEEALLVLDAVLGTGRHRVASHLHLHPDLPEGTAHVEALGAQARAYRAPLHERFNETREMTELRVEAEAELPWAGGWWIELGGGGRPAVELRFERGALQAVIAGRGLRVRWELGAPPGARSVSFVETAC